MRFHKKLAASGKQLFAVREVDRAGLSVRVTSLERTLVDVLDRPDLGGGWEEIWRSLEMAEFFDLDVVIEYTLLLENAAAAAKVGFFLEQHKEALMVEASHLDPQRARQPRKPHYLMRGHREGRLVPEWNLVVISISLCNIYYICLLTLSAGCYSRPAYPAAPPAHRGYAYGAP